METTTISITSIIILILQGGITLIVSIVGWLIKDLIKGIYLQLREMNGNVRDLKAWKDVHQPEEERWQRQNHQDHKELWGEIKTMRDNK